MKRIAIDMDEVIADAHDRALSWYRRDFGVDLTLEEMTGKQLDIAVPEAHRDTLRSYFRHADFFHDLPVIPRSKEVIQRLSTQYEIFITTAAMEYPNSFLHKLSWLNIHFPYISWKNIVFCGDKSIIHADYLIDDNVRHFGRFTGQGILFTALHNKNEKWPVRVNSWEEVEKLLLSRS